MLPTAEVVQLVASKLRNQTPSPQLVVDPVMVSTSGHALADGSVAQALLRDLMPLATLVTPNLLEASALLGGVSIRSVEAMDEAARKLQVLTGCGAVLVKGGHLLDVQGGGSGSSSLPQQVSSSSLQDTSHSDEVVDVLFDGEQVWRLALPRVQTGNTHGTGCTLASSISAGLAKGVPLLQAVHEAKVYVHTALQASSGLSIGTGVQRPFNHGYMLTSWSGDTGNRAPTAATSSHASNPSPVRGSLAGGDGVRVHPEVVRQAMRVYAVTDPGCNARAGRSMVEAVEQAVRGGATIVQIREKDAGGGSFLEAAEAAYQVTTCIISGYNLHHVRLQHASCQVTTCIILS
jgi:hydroxymethylpyrimidine kinase/phosphomethylpyrimidine kinase/thiamine-phosphate diphosphorylase